MRPFEILLVTACGLILIRSLLGERWRKASRLLALILVILLPLQIILEKPRWQMIPIYIFAAILFLLALRKWLGTKRMVSPHRRWPALVGLVVLALLCAAPILFPIPSIAQPSGPYSIGTQTFYWIDESRQEIYNSPPGGSRKIMVQVWYPANLKPGDVPAPYLDTISAGTDAIAKRLGLPPFLLSHLNLARSHAVTQAAVAAAENRYPVLVFSHGWTGLRVQNTYQVEELVSHGYVVIAPDHTYGASFVVFPDGSVALNNSNALPSGVSDAEYNRAAQLLGQTWTGDVRFVMDQLTKIQDGSIPSVLTGRLDLERIGVFGHSTGGGAAVEICWSDPRCKAGLAMDAWLVPYSREMVSQGLSKPFFFLQSELWPNGSNTDIYFQLLANTKADHYLAAIQGARHYDFTDIPLLTPLAATLGLKGPINGPRALQITNAYTIAFFDHYFKGTSSPLLLGPAQKFPEVTFSTQ